MPLPAQRQSATGPEVQPELAWFNRLVVHAATLLAEGAPVILAGDFNVVDREWADALRTVHLAEPLWAFRDDKRERVPRDKGSDPDTRAAGCDSAASPIASVSGEYP